MRRYRFRRAYPGSEVRRTRVPFRTKQRYLARCCSHTHTDALLPVRLTKGRRADREKRFGSHKLVPTPEWHVRGKVAPRCKQHVIARRLHIIRSPRGRWSLFGSSTPTVRFLGVMPSLVAELTVSSAQGRGTCVANEQRGLVKRCHDCWRECVLWLSRMKSTLSMWTMNARIDRTSGRRSQTGATIPGTC
ncbi:hypothetical protein ABIE52_000355 [Rhodococcus sp. OAS809]